MSTRASRKATVFGAQSCSRAPWDGRGDQITGSKPLIHHVKLGSTPQVLVRDLLAWYCRLLLLQADCGCRRQTTHALITTRGAIRLTIAGARYLSRRERRRRPPSARFFAHAGPPRASQATK